MKVKSYSEVPRVVWVDAACGVAGLALAGVSSYCLAGWPAVGLFVGVTLMVSSMVGKH